ncbi:MAG TPA: transcription elongation factor GreB [Xanthomonadales bacterium]|nr:transcription elongation factor GreB [Xanthomonadales bacterium]
MGRWRPPQEQGTALVTPEGHARLKAELDELWRLRRPEVVAALSAAAAEGDRSENAEYIYRKKQLAEIDRRVRYLGNRIPELKVVRDPPGDPRAIYFGASFTLEAEDGSEKRCRIVGPDETDAARGDISIDSPMARALLGKRADDEVVVQLPSGPAAYVVIEVAYGGG